MENGSGEPLTPEQVRAFEEKYGEDQVAVIRKRNRRKPEQFDFELVIRAPTAQEYQLFKSRSMAEASRARAQELLVRQVLLHPSVERFGVLLARWPGMCESTAVTQAVQEMLGLVSDEVEKG